jgi:hypothetical protein
VRKSITMRFDPDLLAKARFEAARENRSLTNFIETVVRQRVADASPTPDLSKAAVGEPSPPSRRAAGQNR